MNNKQNMKAVLINIAEFAFLPFPDNLKCSLTLLFKVVANSLLIEFLNRKIDWALLYIGIYNNLDDLIMNKRLSR